MKCLNTRAKLIIQQLYEAMFHESYMLTEGSHAKINNNPAYMPVVIEKVGRLPGYGEIISIAHYGEQSGDLMADPEMEFTIIGGDYYPISFRNDYLCKHNSIFEDDGIKSAPAARLNHLRQSMDAKYRRAAENNYSCSIIRSSSLKNSLPSWGLFELSC